MKLKLQTVALALASCGMLACGNEESSKKKAYEPQEIPCAEAGQCQPVTESPKLETDKAPTTPPPALSEIPCAEPGMCPAVESGAQKANSKP